MDVSTQSKLLTEAACCLSDSPDTAACILYIPQYADAFFPVFPTSGRHKIPRAEWHVCRQDSAVSVSRSAVRTAGSREYA